MNTGRLLPRAVLALAIATTIAAAPPYRDQLNAAVFKVWLAGFGILAPLAYLILYTLARSCFCPDRES